MVTVFTFKNVKFKIYPRDHNPPHVHAEGGGAQLRVNLLDFELMDDETGFSKSMVREIVEHVKKHHAELLEQWEDFHGEERD